MIIFAAIMVTIDVLCRKFLNVTLAGSDEISGYLFAIATTWALPYTLLHRANVRIDALYVLMPQGIRACLDLFGLILMSFFAWILTWRAFALLADNISINALSVTPLHVPLPIPQTFWLIGWVLFCLCLLLVVVSVINAMFRRDLRRVHELAGALSLEDEFKEEGIELLANEKTGVQP